jgi:hypothetical protein
MEERPVPLHRLFAPVALAGAIAAAVALPAGSAAQSAPPTQVWIDVATHNMANMPGMGGLGRFAMGMMGGDKSRPLFPTTEHPGSTGRYLDVAVHNRLKPGMQVRDAAPAGLGLGDLYLLPPPSVAQSHASGTPQDPPDVEITVREYWGCGALPGPGQPKVSTYTMKGGAASMQGGMTPGIYAPERDVQPTPAHVLWPNKVHGEPVPETASLVGTHRFAGEGIPASLKFDLDQRADFMPKIDLTSSGEDDMPIELRWQPVERAQAYFLTATQMDAAVKPGANKISVVVWSSSGIPGAGATLVDYLGASNIDNWLKKKILLPPSATNCSVPQGIFASKNGLPNMTMLDMVAYGPETHLAYPAKPTDPKKLAAWKPEWTVRVRTKSTASVVLGLDTNASPEQQKESIGKKLFKGLFKRGL